MNKRMKDIDILRGLCIILMILGHVELGEIFNHYIHAFHMPIFFLVSGLFFKRNLNVKFIDYICKLIKKYIVPYVIFSFFYYFISCILQIDFIGYKESLIPFFTVNDIFLPIGGALWFLTSFFFSQLIIYFINKYIKKEKFFFSITILIGIFGIYINNIFSFRLWWSISSSLVGVALISIGYIINKYNILDKVKFKNKNIVNILLTIILFIINLFFILKSGYVNMRTSTYPNILLFIFNLFISLIVYINISNILLKIKKLDFLSNKIIFIGEYSIIFLCINQFVILLLNQLISLTNLNNVIFSKIIISILSIFLIYVIAKLILLSKIKIIFGYEDYGKAMLNFIKKYKNIFISIFILFAIRFICNISLNGFSDIILLSLIIFSTNKINIEFVNFKFDIISFIFSFFLSSIILIGKEIYYYHNINNIIESPIKYLIIFIGIIILLYYLLLFINKYTSNISINQKENKFSKKTILLMICILIFAYTICYLSFFPGIFSYDMPTQDCMAKGLCELTNHHPVLHTYIWKVFLKLKYITNINYLDIVGYSVFQMLIVIFTYIKLILWQIKNKWNNKYILFTYIYFLINPILHAFSFNPIKDVLFACFLLLFLINLYDLLKIKNIKNILKVFIFCLLTCLFRNNAIYVIIFISIFLIIFIRKKYLIFTILCSIITYFIITTIIFSILHIQKSSTAEMLSIPLVQMSNTYINTDTYSDIDKKFLKDCVPGIEKYNYRISDPVKDYFNQEYYNSNKKMFWILYLKGLKNNKILYIVTALDLDIPYWYYDSDMIDKYNKRVYIGDKLYDDDLNKKLPIFFQKVHNYYVKVDNTTMKYMNFPIINLFFTLSFNFWLLLICLYHAIKSKNKENITIILILIVLLLTYLLGPIANFRYIYPFYFTLPFYVGIVFCKQE